jgi:type IV secretory pathway TraG/TraD family ATPase VirD4
MDRERRDVVGPLLATVLHMVITRNVAKRRQDPLIVAIDELPTLYLPTLVQWLNENREDGLSVILGFQNLVQLEKTYGRELARAILGACATKAIFNPQEYEAARMFSDFLGDEEIRYKQKSRNRGAANPGSFALANHFSRDPETRTHTSTSTIRNLHRLGMPRWEFGVCCQPPILGSLSCDRAELSMRTILLWCQI